MKTASNRKLTYIFPAIAIIFYLSLYLVGILSCWLYEITGLKCPACGGCHMVIALLKLQFIEAYNANAFILITFIPLLLLLLLCKRKHRIMCGYLVVFLIWGVFRNFIGM